MDNGLTPIPHTPCFETLVKSHREAFQRLARRLAGNPEDAEDLLQETLLDAYRGFGGFRPGSQFYSWVARIMTNNHLDRRRRKHHPMVPLDGAGQDGETEALQLPDDSANPECVLLHEQLDGSLQSALDQLQPAQRATVLLCDLEGATYEEAAAVEACPIGTIRSRLHRAHKMLRDLVSHLDPQAALVRREAALASAQVRSRRAFLCGTMAAAGAAFSGLNAVEEALADAEMVRVLLWSDTPLDNAAGATASLLQALRAQKRVEVRTASLTDTAQGLADESLQWADVLIWCGQDAHDTLQSDRAQAVVRRVRDEGMGLIALHGAHAAQPLRTLLGPDCGWQTEAPEAAQSLEFRVTAPRHPIARGVSNFRLAHAASYPGAFNGPRPDVLVFDSPSASTGERTWQGMVWTIGRGRIFLFQPGHETAPLYQQDELRRILENAVQWGAHR